TRGRALRNAMAVSFFLGFLPPALLGLWLKNNHWLWGSMLLFMMMRAATLARANRVLAQREG
ncbi:MAG: MATE family efflux transporter, partial [Calditrichaeota bacterium]